MSSGDWASTREAVERLNATGKVGTAENELLECARRHDAQTRASYVLRDGLAVEIPSRMSGRVWDAIAEAGRQDWQAGVFDYTTPAPSGLFGGGETLNWRAIGVEFYWPDITALLGLSVEPITAVREPLAGDAQNVLRGVMLQGRAKPNDWHYEAAAHHVAEIVRAKKLKPWTAINQIAPDYPGKKGTPESSKRAIYQAYCLMYFNNGSPHQN